MITVSQIRGAAGAEYYCTGAEAPNVVSYYLDAPAHNEPAGVWSGSGAQALGLTGEVADEAMRSVFGQYLTPDGRQIGRAARGGEDAKGRMAAALAAEPDADQARREQIRREVEAQSPTTGFDFTFSPVKSVTVLHTAAMRMEILAERAGDLEAVESWRSVRVGIEAAVLEGNRAAMAYLESHATTRVGRHGTGAVGRWMAARGLVVGSFLQFTSRAIDPQLHVHNTTLNRVQSHDGVWRALDGKDLMRHQHAAGQIGQAVMRDRLAADLGVDRWQTRQSGGYEIEFVPQEMCDLLSSRRKEIEARYAPAVAALEEIRGRELTDLELCHVRDVLNLSARRGKAAEAETWSELSDRIAARAATVGQSMELVAHDLLAHQAKTARAGQAPADQWSASAVIGEAITMCGQESATFTGPDLTAQILRLLPPVLGLTAEETVELAERLTVEARRRADLVQVSGRRGDADLFGRPTDDRFAAVGTIEAEQAIRRLAVQRGAHHLEQDKVHAWLDANGDQVGEDQRAAVAGIASSDAALCVLVGPAGTGKSYTMGALAGAWADLTGDGRVIGLATSQVAANVLRDDGLQDSFNVAAFLAGHSRIEAGEPLGTDRAMMVGPSDVVLVDEASMVATVDLSAIREHVEAAGARLVLTGDPNQLSAVGAGGAMGLLSERAETFTLTEVRRFAEPWERDASLRLRAGDVDVLAVYDAHARLQGHRDVPEAIQAAASAWIADHLDGCDVIVVATSNDLAARISQVVRDRRIRYGEVDPGSGVRLGRDGNEATVGDLVQARRIDRRLGLTNRETYEVIGLGADGALEVVCTRTGEQLHVPASYAAADMALAYASTVHAAQGRTTDTCHYVVASLPDAPAMYVAVTRGRTRNTIHTPLTLAPDDVAPGVSATASQPTPIDALRAVFARDESGLAALVEAEADAERRASAAQILARIEEATRAASKNRLERYLDDLVVDGVLSNTERARLCADQTTEHLARLLRTFEQAGQDPRVVLRAAVVSRELGTAESIARTLSYRITSTMPTPEPADDAVPGDIAPEESDQLSVLRVLAKDRAHDLGVAAAEEPPAWALNVLGPVPEAEDPRRNTWVDRAGSVAVFREATGWDDQTRVLPAPPVGPHSTERRAWYMTAWDAAGGPEVDRPVAMWTDTQIRAALRAERTARAWEVPDATPELKAAEQSRETARQAAALREREADLVDQADEADRLRLEAAEHRAEVSRLASEIATHEQKVANREAWVEATLPSLNRADKARAEAEARGLTLDDEPDRTTAAGWLEADRAARIADDAHREITETDIHDETTEETVVPADLDSLPAPAGDNTQDPSHVESSNPSSAPKAEPVVGSPARRAGFIAQTEVLVRAADIASQDTTEPDDRRHRWVLDEATDPTTNSDDRTW